MEIIRRWIVGPAKAKLTAPQTMKKIKLRRRNAKLKPSLKERPKKLAKPKGRATPTPSRP